MSDFVELIELPFTEVAYNNRVLKSLPNGVFQPLPTNDHTPLGVILYQSGLLWTPDKGQHLYVDHSTLPDRWTRQEIDNLPLAVKMLVDLEEFDQTVYYYSTYKVYEEQIGPWSYNIYVKKPHHGRIDVISSDAKLWSKDEAFEYLEKNGPVEVDFSDNWKLNMWREEATLALEAYGDLPILKS